MVQHFQIRMNIGKMDNESAYNLMLTLSVFEPSFLLAVFKCVNLHSKEGKVPCVSNFEAQSTCHSRIVRTYYDCAAVSKKSSTSIKSAEDSLLDSLIHLGDLREKVSRCKVIQQVWEIEL